MRVAIAFSVFIILGIVLCVQGAKNRRSYPITLPGFHRGAHGVSSGDVIILDDKRIKIKKFRYDGSAPDVFFWVGTGSRPNKDGRQIQNEKGSSDRLEGYEGKDIELELPNGVTINDIDWLSIWCRRYATNFGHVLIPKN